MERRAAGAGQEVSPSAQLRDRSPQSLKGRARCVEEGLQLWQPKLGSGAAVAFGNLLAAAFESLAQPRRPQR